MTCQCLRLVHRQLFPFCIWTMHPLVPTLQSPGCPPSDICSSHCATINSSSSFCQSRMAAAAGGGTEMRGGRRRSAASVCKVKGTAFWSSKWEPLLTLNQVVQVSLSFPSNSFQGICVWIENIKNRFSERILLLLFQFFNVQNNQSHFYKTGKRTLHALQVT